MEDRITQIRKSININQEEFALRLNLSRSFINQVEKGKKNISERTILDICREFNVNEEWLRTGEGEMFAPIAQEQELASLTAKLLTESNDSFKNRFVSLLAKMTDEQWEMLENMVEMLSKKE